MTVARWAPFSAFTYATERRFGSFQRSVMLPEGVDPESVNATHANGVLTVRVPLPETPEVEEPRKVYVDVATEG